MINIIALIFALFILMKMAALLLFPNWIFEIADKCYQVMTEYGLMLQAALMIIAIIIGGLLTMMIGFFTMIAAGWFWACTYSIFLLPMVIEAIKKDRLKDMIFSPDVKNLFLAACIYMICLSILTIGVFL